MTVCGFLLLTGVPPAAHAMLKCQLADDAVSYVSERVSGARCTRIDSQLEPSSSLRPSRAGLAFAAARPSTPPPETPAPALANPAATPASAPGGAPGKREVQAKIYSYVEDGVRHYFSRRPAGASGNVEVIRLHYMETCYLCGSTTAVSIGALSLDTAAYGREIEAAARDFGVEKAVIRAVIHAESAYRPNAISRAGAQGLMQLMPATARRFGVEDAFDAAQNIRGGVRYLAWLLKRFNGNFDLALAGFNAGEAAVDKYNGVPPYAETEHYVSRVKALADRYRNGH